MINNAIVTILANFSKMDFGLVQVEADRCVQIVQLSVRTTDREDSLMIVNTYPEPIRQSRCENLSQRLRNSTANEVISFLIADGEGWIHLKTEESECNIFSLAAGAAVYKASCGWDESPSMVVKINDAEVSVLPRFVGNHWVVTSLP